MTLSLSICLLGALLFWDALIRPPYFRLVNPCEGYALLLLCCFILWFFILRGKLAWPLLLEWDLHSSWEFFHYFSREYRVLVCLMPWSLFRVCVIFPFLVDTVVAVLGCASLSLCMLFPRGVGWLVAGVIRCGLWGGLVPHMLSCCCSALDWFIVTAYLSKLELPGMWLLADCLTLLASFANSFHLYVFCKLWPLTVVRDVRWFWGVALCPYYVFGFLLCFDWWYCFSFYFSLFYSQFLCLFGVFLCIDAVSLHRWRFVCGVSLCDACARILVSCWILCLLRMCVLMEVCSFGLSPPRWLWFVIPIGLCVLACGPILLSFCIISRFVLTSLDVLNWLWLLHLLGFFLCVPFCVPCRLRGWYFVCDVRFLSLFSVVPYFPSML